MNVRPQLVIPPLPFLDGVRLDHNSAAQGGRRKKRKTRRKRKTKKRRKTRRKKRKYKTKRKRRNSRKRTKSLKGGWSNGKSYNHLNVQHSGNHFIHVPWWGGRMTIGKVKNFCADYLGMYVAIWLYGDGIPLPDHFTMNQLGLKKGSTVGMTIV